MEFIRLAIWKSHVRQRQRRRSMKQIFSFRIFNRVTSIKIHFKHDQSYDNLPWELTCQNCQTHPASTMWMPEFIYRLLLLLRFLLIRQLLIPVSRTGFIINFINSVLKESCRIINQDTFDADHSQMYVLRQMNWELSLIPKLKLFERKIISFVFLEWRNEDFFVIAF